MDLECDEVVHVPYRVVDALALEAVRGRQPFSLIRLGDGESALLGYPGFGHPNHFARWMTNFFGPHGLPNEAFGSLRADVAAAIRNADVIGTDGRRLRDVETARAQLLELEQRPVVERQPDHHQRLNFMERTLLNHHVAQLGPLRGIFTANNVHIHMERAGVLKRMIQAVRSVTLIGCRYIRKDLSAKYGKRVDHIAIPGEYKFDSEKRRQMRTERPPHYPDVYLDVRRRLQEGGFRDLVLVGAGPCGKVYCEDVRAAGGVAIDIGSIMDLWSNARTRSYMQDIARVTL